MRARAIRVQGQFGKVVEDKVVQINLSMSEANCTTPDCCNPDSVLDADTNEAI